MNTLVNISEIITDQRRLTRLLLNAVLVVALSPALPTCLRAQVVTATVNGVVRDSSGAVIPGASVTLQNLDTGFRQTTVTNGVGIYVIERIPPGQYSLTVSKPGFKAAVRRPITLTVNQSSTFDFTLTVGSPEQIVTVHAPAVALQTSSSELGTVMNSQEIDNLPLNGRNFTQLLTLTPGASPVNTGQGASGWRTNASGAFTFPSINGQTNRSNMWLLDGVTDSENITQTPSITPIVDDIKEFKIDSHNDQAQFGGVTGGVINVVTKSGTNEFHGAGWEFLRNSGMDARNPFFANVNPLRQNQFGANIGGPVLLPHYNGRNRTFFFGSYEGLRQHSASQRLYAVPTPAELNGDLSGLGVPIYNPFSTVPDPANPGKLLRQQFAGDVIPPNLLDPNMVKYANLVFPKPVATGVPGLNGLDNTPHVQDYDEYNIRADEQLNPSNSFWFRFSHDSAPVTGSGGFVGLLSDTYYLAYNAAGSWTHTFGPTAVMQLQFGRNISTVGPQTIFVGGNPAQIISQTGFAQGFACGFKYSFRSCMLPGMGISGFVGGGESNGAPNNNSNTYELTGNFTKVYNKHTFSLGANFDTNNQSPTHSAGEGVSFSAFQTSNLETGQGGSALASFLLGVPDSGNRNDIQGTEHGGWTDGFYFQDQWKATNRLTVNMGIRYDFTLMPIYGTAADGTDKVGITDLNNGTYVLEHASPPCSATQVAPCIPGGILPAHVVVSPNGKLFNNDYKNIQPRVGLAYRLTNNNVIRAAYGRFYDNWAAIDQTAQNIQAWPTVTYVLAQNLNPAVPSVFAENPFQGFTGPYPPPTPFNQVGWNSNPLFKNPYSDQWNFGIQHLFGSSTVMTLNYVGSHSGNTDIAIMGNSATVPGPGPITAREPYPYITPTFYDNSIGRGSYNAFQFSLNRETSHGLTYLISYTWSKAIDIGSDGWYCAEGCSIENPYDINANKSVAGFDLTHVLTASYVYQLPFGKGNFRTGSRVVNSIIGNWQTNGILTLSSGIPYTINVCGDIANTGNGGCYERPNVVGNPNLSNPSPALWINPAAFASPSPYTFGNMGRNVLRSDWYKDIDLSLFREFPISESKRFEFRFDAFNATNTPTWGTPQSTLNNINFGEITGTRSTERQLQLALKFYF